ncbi:MAG: anhydro-N-acetylmuramic acid kinase [Flavobacteriales bacterium]|nr:anhydro-N-acetylmuramic acid kinase [Flavobacteriales bacterium]
MLKEEYFAIGMMSGTSLDGLDISYTRFSRENDIWSFDILRTKSVSYSEEMLQDLRESVYMSGLELTELDTTYGKFLASQVNQFIADESINKVDVIGSHGHTVFHQPDKGYTLQIGDASWINKVTGVKVVADFRRQDVVMGGQGAPLVPIGDKLLFSEYDCRINIGGFANISFENEGKTTAFDICPVNTILNYLSNQLGFEFDDRGNIAKSGIIISQLFDELNSLEYYFIDGPKSLGIEWNESFVKPLLVKYSEYQTKDLIRTFTEHVAFQISRVIVGRDKTVLYSGGGTYNDFLLYLISSNSDSKSIILDDKITEFKEALVFSFLAVLKTIGEVNCLSEVTGADKDHSSGVIFEI